MHHKHDSESLQSRNSSYSKSESGNSSDSHHSRSTQSTQYSGQSRPPFGHHETCEGRLEGIKDGQILGESPRSSTETYASTLPSDVDIEEDWEHSREHQPLPRPGVFESSAIPSTPADFAELFPSERLLYIKHDDSTPDGNMNLRVDTVYEASRRNPVDITLFHLRMHDLKNRDFSLRRYCRESGREVCHSVRKYQKSAAERRTGLQRSLSNAFASLRTISDHKTSTVPPEKLKRSDSGYESLRSRKSVDLEHWPHPGTTVSKSHVQIPTKTVKLEFSNYAQVDVKRRGAKSHKRYEFEYWGVHYFWKRIVDRTASAKEISFRLFRGNDDFSLARVSPTPMSGVQEREEMSKGGWIPPCTMRITDRQVTKDQTELSDVIVATGLIALVDDCIKRRFHTKAARGIVIPVPKFRVDMEFIGTKRQFNDYANRPSTRGSVASHRPTPLRKTSCDIY